MVGWGAKERGEGDRLTMNALLVARATERQCSIVSSSVSSLVSCMPSATMARLSPTKTTSIPFWSATWADGKSCAVIIAIGSFLRYIVCKV